MSLDKHRESLVKYCYDISKVSFAVAVLNPVMGKSATFVDAALGVGLTVFFLSLALYLEKGHAT